MIHSIQQKLLLITVCSSVAVMKNRKKNSRDGNTIRLSTVVKGKVGDMESKVLAVF